MKIRPTKPEDISALQTVVEQAEMFPPEMLPGMFAPSQDEGDPSLWLTCEHDGKAVGFCYTVPEKMADGAWNMLAIAVLSSLHGQGAGTLMTEALEAHLASEGQRLIVVDTSGLPEFEATHGFYRARGYREEARIADFWAPGDDKVIFTKALG